MAAGACDSRHRVFVDMLDQTTLGHRMIADEFGPEAVPTVAWQIDLFGSVRKQPPLSRSWHGLAIFWSHRLQGYGDSASKPQRRFIWRASPSLGADAQVFAGLTAVPRHY